MGGASSNTGLCHCLLWCALSRRYFSSPRSRWMDHVGWLNRLFDWKYTVWLSQSQVVVRLQSVPNVTGSPPLQSWQLVGPGIMCVYKRGCLTGSKFGAYRGGHIWWRLWAPTRHGLERALHGEERACENCSLRTRHLKMSRWLQLKSF